MMNLPPPLSWSDLATKRDLDSLRSDLLRTFGTWLFASQAAVIITMRLLLGLTR